MLTDEEKHAPKIRRIVKCRPGSGTAPEIFAAPLRFMSYVLYNLYDVKPEEVNTWQNVWGGHGWKMPMI